jgi:hypothetical protein
VEAVTVAASDPLDRRAPFSNHGLGVDLTAPGTGILSLRAAGTDFYGDGTHIVGGRYYWANGTSMAAPHVAGAAALLIARFPALRVAQYRDRLAHAADDLNGANPADAGRLGGGRLNAERALTLALPRPALALSGTVVDRQGAPVPSVMVELGEMGSQRAFSAADGTYTFRGLREGGRYTVGASRVGFDLTPPAYAFRPLPGSADQRNFVGVKRWEVGPADASAFAAGWGTALALDAQGRPRIAYYVDGTHSLRYASWTGHVWNLRTVDVPGPDPFSRAGRYPSLALDASGRPHISYTWWGGQGELSHLRYARWDTFAGWVIEVVDPAYVQFETRIAVDATGRVHLSYYDNALRHMKYAWKDGAGWHYETIDASGEAGDGHSMALDAQGRPHVTYQDLPIGPNGVAGLRYAYRDGGTWHLSVVDGANGNYGGTWSSLALDAAGRPQVVYAGLDAKNLKYGRFTGSGWELETIRAGFAPGFGQSLELEAGGPRVVYQSLGEGFLYATRSASGWTSGVVQRGNAGYFNDLAQGSDGTLHASCYDKHNAYLSYARSVQLTDPPYQPPAVAITSPGNGSVVSGLVTVQASAQSPVGLQRVELYVDGTLHAVDAAAPYAFAWDSTAAANVVHTLTARAHDATGAAAQHSVQVQVVNLRPE